MKNAKTGRSSGPHFAGWEMYHLKGSPVDPNRLYASQIERLVRPDDAALRRRRQDLGAGRQRIRLRRRPRHPPVVRRHPAPWEFKRVWHLEPSLTDPDTVYAGVEDAALFKSTDGGKTWQELSGLRDVTGHLWQPGAGGMCLHTIILDPDNPDRIYVAISAAGAFRTDDGGKTWLPINKGLQLRMRAARSGRRSRPLRPQPRHAPVAARTRSSCRSTGT